MKKQRNMFQTEEQDKSSGTDLNEIEENDLLDREFRVTIINILTKVRRTVYEQSENFNRERKCRVFSIPFPYWIRTAIFIPFFKRIKEGVRSVFKHIRKCLKIKYVVFDIFISEIQLPYVTLTYRILLRIFKNSGKLTTVQIKESKCLNQAAVVPIWILA